MKQVQLSKVINFSDICFLLFDGAKRPTALCIFQPSDQTQRLSDYRFDYWCPKADPLLQKTRMLVLSKGDKVSLKLSTVLHDPGAWGRYLWMTNRDMKLLSWLNQLSRLHQKMVTYKTARMKSYDCTSKPWIIGQGFKPENIDRREDPKYKTKMSKYVGSLPYLNANRFSEWVIPTVSTPGGQSSTVYCSGFEEGFLKPQILIPQGIKRNTGLLRAAFSEQDLCFQDSIQAIKFPPSDTSRMKLLTAVLNSRFAAWYYFHETANLGADRAKVHEAQLLALPFPEVEELPDAAIATEVANKIIEIIDELLLHKDDYSHGQFPNDKTLSELNQLVYRYYGLTEQEIAIIEDTLDYVLPSIQPRSKSYPKLWDKASKEQWQEYVATLLSTLGEWLDDGSYLSATLITDNPDVLLLGLQLQNSRPEQTITICERGNAFKEVLSGIDQSLRQQTSRNIQIMPDLRIVVADTLYLLKPPIIRYWLKSTALNDADAIISDFQTQRFHAPNKG